MTRLVEVKLAARSYPIHIGDGLLEQLPALLNRASGSRFAIVTNTTVAALYLEKLLAALGSCGTVVEPIVIPDGEAHKTIETWAGVHDQLLGARLDRKSMIVALGGGVVGDIAGFAA
ncbi:MAG: iron-containing alcohol dehydrogenase, partial [Prolixibacteraceae bacterium]|nr:iron-containing alcohol dehydrogenase [Burkholderiales bacterium]